MNTDYIVGWFVGALIGLFGGYIIRRNRVKELEIKEDELYYLKIQIQELKQWCSYDSPEIGFAMLHLERQKNSVSGFRDKLRRGEFTFTNFKPQNNN